MKTYSNLAEKQIQHNFKKLEKNEREQIIIEFLNLDVEEWEHVTTCNYNEFLIEYGKNQYLVVDDDEAENLWIEDLENYIEECVICEIPENYKQYFNNDKFIEDCKIDGRANSLNRYDGTEEEINGFFIYRQN